MNFSQFVSYQLLSVGRLQKHLVYCWHKINNLFPTGILKHQCNTNEEEERITTTDEMTICHMPVKYTLCTYALRTDVFRWFLQR